MVLSRDTTPVLRGLLSIYNITDPEEHNELERLSEKFTFSKLVRDDKLWSEGLDNDLLYFVLSGSFGEYLRQPSGTSLIRLYQSEKFAFSEDLLLYGVPSETYCVALTDGVVASISKTQLLSSTGATTLGPKLIALLINLSMIEYRNTTYEMLQTNGKTRIKAALGQSPNLLNIIPRKELADYLGISRASLFRALKSLGHDE